VAFDFLFKHNYGFKSYAALRAYYLKEKKKKKKAIVKGRQWEKG
jgi:hypothetical protein